MSRKPAPCGTNAAYMRHRRRHEPIDDACLAAHNAHGRGRSPLEQILAEARAEALEALSHRHPEEYAALLATAERELLAEAMTSC